VLTADTYITVVPEVAHKSAEDLARLIVNPARYAHRAPAKRPILSCLNLQVRARIQFSSTTGSAPSGGKSSEVWDLGDQRKVTSTPLPGPVTALATDDDGDLVVGYGWEPAVFSHA
jgi:hypothetical protein